MHKKLLLKVLNWTIIPIALIFFAKTIYDNWGRLDALDITPSLAGVAGSILFVLAVPVIGLIWGSILNDLSDKTISKRQAIKIQLASWLLKYIPGQAGAVVNKITWGNKHGYSKKLIFNSFIYETVLLEFSAVVLALPVLAFAFPARLDRVELAVFLPLLVLIPMLIVLHKPYFIWIVNRLLSVMKKQPIEKTYFLETTQIIRYTGYFIMPRVLNAIGFVLIAGSLLAVDSLQMALVLGVGYVLAVSVGKMAIFVPSGIGAREAAIVLFASLYFPVEQAIVLSVVARFYATFADLIIAGIYMALNKGKLSLLSAD